MILSSAKNGVYCITRYKLKLFISSFLLASGNAGKMIGFGCLALKVGPWPGVAVVAAFSLFENWRKILALLKFYFDRLTASKDT